jgi:pyridinium-3,5-bisthiocarboxylic acid mononucleotide nickel chelatase
VPAGGDAGPTGHLKLILHGFAGIVTSGSAECYNGVMRIAHFDCFSGISGDMTLAALISAGVPQDAIEEGIASLQLPVRLEIQNVKRASFAALHVKVHAEDQKAHRHLHHVEEIINKGTLTPPQQELALRIFRRLAEAEAAAHGSTIQKVHFHEVGALDSIVDIVGAAIGLDLLGVDRFTSRSVPPGHGMVHAAHGLMPIPAPGTAELLKGVPLAASLVEAELTTPTGAAILTTIVQEWTDQPMMTVERIGLGAGTKDFKEQPNILRLFVGTAPGADGCRGDLAESDQVWVLETNLDDLPPEVIGYCYDLLFAAGALDVFTQPIYMKKNRPGVLLTVLAPESAIPAVEGVLFRETTTFGIRKYAVKRRKLQRAEHTVQTRWGRVKGKLGWFEGQPPTFSPEYEECARIAREHSVPLRQVFEEASRAYRPT